MLSTELSGESKTDSKSLPYPSQVESKAVTDAAAIFARILEILGVKNAPEAARVLGLTKQSVYDWREKTPSVENLIKIARTGNASLHWILTGEGPKRVGAAEFDLEASIERHGTWRPVLDEWFDFEGKYLPEFEGASLMYGWDGLDPETRIAAIRDLKKILDAHAEPKKAK